MMLLMGSCCLVLGFLVFVGGFVTEWKQSRDQGPVAIVATLPDAIQAAMLMSLGLAMVPTDIPWWVPVLAFPVLALVFCKLLLMANGRSKAID